MPKLKGVAFETAIIERYRRQESSVEEALIEMYLAGVSVRRVEDSFARYLSIFNLLRRLPFQSHYFKAVFDNS